MVSDTLTLAKFGRNFMIFHDFPMILVRRSTNDCSGLHWPLSSTPPPRIDSESQSSTREVYSGMEDGSVAFAGGLASPKWIFRRIEVPEPQF